MHAFTSLFFLSNKKVVIFLNKVKEDNMYTIIYAIKTIDHHAHLKENKYFTIKRTLREIFLSCICTHSFACVKDAKICVK